MGIASSRERQTASDENPATHSYIYPPKSGLYFGSHFIMGSERFETGQPESYLFGENTDLNFLGSKAVQFPYANPQHSSEPTKTLQSLVHIRRDSIKLVKIRLAKEPAVNILTRSADSFERGLNAPPATLHIAENSINNNSWSTDTLAKTVGTGKNKIIMPPQRTCDGAPKQVSPVRSEPPHHTANCVDLKITSISAETENSNSTALGTTQEGSPLREEAESVSSLSEFDENSLQDSDQICGYNIEFTFDCDCPISICIYYFATGIASANGLQFVSKRPDMTSKLFHYPAGVNQVFSQPEHVFEPALFKKEELQCSPDNDIIPFVIHCRAMSGVNECYQTHSTLAVVEPSAEGNGFIMKPLKQKLCIDGVCYLLQEIYGIENKNSNDDQKSAEEMDDGGMDCVICMSELRDTIILPCRHICLCSGCAETLRYKASNCPICRSPFRALLQVKTVRRTKARFGGGTAVENGDQIPPETLLTRFETNPLVEALNGPGLGSIVPTNSNTLSVIPAGLPTQKSPIVPPVGGKHKRRSGRTVSPIQEVFTAPVTVSTAVLSTQTSVGGQDPLLKPNSAGSASVCASLPGSFTDTENICSNEVVAVSPRHRRVTATKTPTSLIWRLSDRELNSGEGKLLGKIVDCDDSNHGAECVTPLDCERALDDDELGDGLKASNKYKRLHSITLASGITNICIENEREEENEQRSVVIVCDSDPRSSATVGGDSSAKPVRNMGIKLRDHSVDQARPAHQAAPVKQQRLSRSVEEVNGNFTPLDEDKEFFAKSTTPSGELAPFGQKLISSMTTSDNDSTPVSSTSISSNSSTKPLLSPKRQLELDERTVDV